MQAVTGAILKAIELSTVRECSENRSWGLGELDSRNMTNKPPEVQVQAEP
jgi:hypothetical protein